MPTIADIFDLPVQVHQGDFVLRLAEGVERAEQTLNDYVVTPQLAQCFDAALTLIGSAVTERTSKGAYLHGSFGSGKSHFMAVLTLLLQGDARARSIPELAGAVTNANAWTAGRRFLVVPYHLIGAASMESALLGRYAEHVRKLHPEAPTPGFYQAESVFEDAGRLRATMGDDAFFSALNRAVRGAADDGAGGGGGGWGELGSGWDAAGFDTALAAAPGDAERVRLTGDLIDAFFGALRTSGGSGERFVDLDAGLAVMAQHAAELGYDALILFLDELILWLASHAADAAFVSREGQKVAKLVESARADRPLPIISFIARQRDLRELVGEHLPGAEQLGFADVLNWWEARFDRITLEDRNLPAIAERRVLRPRNAAARQQIDDAFERTADVRREVMAVLLTRDADRDVFRQLYPFTPALVQALIAVSSLLQRERTALKIMLQLLVEQGRRLQLGDVIPVGDLFDVIARGDEPFTQAMRMRFDEARKLYRTKLRPMLESEHRVTTDEMEAGTADANRAAHFRSDDRLLKTLLLATLAEGVEALRLLTPARLAALNHGTVRTPIPGQEQQMVLTKCQRWAGQIGELKISGEGVSPLISLQIVGVDTESILQNAVGHDNAGNRLRKVREIIYDDLGIDDADSHLHTDRFEMWWRGTRRRCEVLFGNLRAMQLEDLRGESGTWHVVIGRPFDKPQHTPLDHRAKVQSFIDAEVPADTLVWQPLFLSAAAQDELGRLVMIDEVLIGNRLDQAGTHLSPIDREQARALLANQRDQIQARIRSYLHAAYGIATPDAGVVDDSLERNEQFVSLNPRCRLRPPAAGAFRSALEQLMDQALEAQYPDHPRFGAEVRRPVLRGILEVVEEAAADPEERVEVPRNLREEMTAIAVPLRLGRTGETHYKLDRNWPAEFENKGAKRDSPVSVGTVRGWIEAPERRGLPRDVQNLVIAAYAAMADLYFSHRGRPVRATIERIDDAWELRAQDLPPAEEYQQAAQRAQELFGYAASPRLSARGVSDLVQAARAAAGRCREPVDELAAELRERLKERSLAAEASDRLRTVDGALAVLSAVAEAGGEDDREVVTVLAAAEITTSAVAMAAVMESAGRLAPVLAPHGWQVFAKLAVLGESYRARVAEMDAELNDALRRDEHVTPLAATVRHCQNLALEFLTEAAGTAPAPPTPPKPPVPPAVKPAPGAGGGGGSGGGGGGPKPEPGARSGRRDVAAGDVAGVFGNIEAAIRETGATRVSVDWKVYSGSNTEGAGG